VPEPAGVRFRQPLPPEAAARRAVIG